MARRTRVSGFPLILTVVVVLAVAMLTPNIRLLISQQRQVQHMQQQVDRDRAHLKSLQQQQARWDDPAYIRAQTRSRLYFVTPGQTTYIALNLPTTSAAAPKPAASVVAARTDWVDVLSSSVVSAGVSTKPLGSSK
jgi:cell division protein FtsB